MKSSAIIRIVLYSILILVLLSVLTAGIGFRIYSFHSFTTSGEYSSVENGEPVNVSADIQKLNIHWASGSVKIQPADIDTIQFQESGSFSEDGQMVWKQSGDTLDVYYSKPELKSGLLASSSKKLTVLVPRQWYCDELSLDVASADILVENLSANEVDIDSASGECEFIDCSVSELDIDTASGRIQYSGTLDALASFTGKFENTPDSIRMDSASGNLNITLPDNSGFRVEMDSLSGKLHTDFNGTYDRDVFVCGDGHCNIRYNGASGSVGINKS